MTGAPVPPTEGWPDPNERNCDACGHVWFAGERQHQYMDGAVRPQDATVLCVLCRRQSSPAPA